MFRGGFKGVLKGFWEVLGWFYEGFMRVLV